MFPPCRGVTGTCNRTTLSKTTTAQIQKLTGPYGYTTVATQNANALLNVSWLARLMPGSRYP